MASPLLGPSSFAGSGSPVISGAAGLSAPDLAALKGIATAVAGDRKADGKSDGKSAPAAGLVDAAAFRQRKQLGDPVVEIKGLKKSTHSHMDPALCRPLSSPCTCLCSLCVLFRFHVGGSLRCG
jgi:hypothetical protein